MDIKQQTYQLIDDLKSVCHNYGMGNDGNEYKVITQIFLYKFLNDKFGYEIKKASPAIAQAEKKSLIRLFRKMTGLTFWTLFPLMFCG